MTPSQTQRGLLILLTVTLAPGLIRSPTKADLASTPLALTHVTVIDATGSPAQQDMTVLVDGGRIRAVGKSADVSVPEGARRVDATGKFLIPGLVDMHVHTTWDQYFIRPLMLANGITGVREMFARDLAPVRQRRREVAEGALSGPRILAAGPIVDGPGGPWPGSIIVRTAAEARAAVDRIKPGGFDFVKVYSSLSRETYFAIADQAKQQGIPYAGHLPDAISALEAAHAGQKSFEHLYGISLACSSREAELRKSLVDPDPKHPHLTYLAEQKAELDSFSREKAAALFAQLKQNGTWQVPTLVVMRNAALIGDTAYVQTLSKSDRLRYVPYVLKMMWGLALRFAGGQRPSEAVSTGRRYFDWELEIVGEMQKAGVEILAGTDTPNPFVFPGFGLHDELGLLVRAGLTPMEALHAATRNPAEFLGTLDSMGTVEVGKIADLDLLDANPLEDIRNTRTVDAVVFGGRLIPRPGLDSLLTQAEKNRWRANPAGLILIGLILGRMRMVLLAGLAVILALSAGIYYLQKRRRVARRLKAESPG